MIRWWEAETVRFECQPGCTRCCSKPGWVFFDKQDVDAAADFLGQSARTFQKKYGLEPLGPGRWEMEVAGDRPCPFLSAAGCSIHPAKPKQCRVFPFWRENLASKPAWEKVAEDCPGIGQGTVFSPARIRQFLKTLWF